MNKDEILKELNDQIDDVFSEIAKEYEIAKESFSNLKDQIYKVLVWKLEATTDKEKEQVSIAIEILTKDLPLTIGAITALRTASAIEMSLEKLLRFVLKIVKIFIFM